MTSRKLREQFLKFFEKKRHKIVPPISLIPTDPSVLFTTAGMQQFKPYYLVEKSPYGQNVCSCQKCFRTSDIEEVGDESHLTFLEMLGNFSFGGYFKKEAISWAYEFIFKELKLPLKETIFTVFEGDKDVPEDEESVEIWKELGVHKNKIKKCGRADNFWGPTGQEGPCGPTTEIHIKGIEVWNLVFNEYYQDKNKQLTPLVQKGVDTGMGLERLAMIVQNKSSVFETDLFESIIGELQKYTGRTPANLKGGRIIADHVKSAVFLISDGILPSNVEKGYVLRRILRRAIRYGKLLNLPANFLILLAQKVIEIYKNVYPEIKSKEEEILTVIQQEEEKFERTLHEGLKQFENISKKGNISGVDAFHLYDTYGFPLELTIELAKERNLNIDQKGFEEAFKKHQEISRAGVESKFGGVGKEVTYETTKLHTATHLLQAALRKILGEHVKQMGSDITSQRLRFDFSHHQKMTENEIKKVQSLVNQKIKEDLEVKKEEMNYKAAIKSGALALGKEDKSSFSPSFPFRGNSVFKEKYPEIVTVFLIEDFSKEICAGPHIKRTSELGLFKIIKEESSGAGVRRIQAILE
ncbi:MAG: alanine--tRNA ligase [Candidatus Nealsonbacteria bacterium]|nr:alanine--tRNA ligase [Candidatus Nealsonbacteria bacterium]